TDAMSWPVQYTHEPRALGNVGRYRWFLIFYNLLFDDAATTEIYTLFPTRRSSDLDAGLGDVVILVHAAPADADGADHLAAGVSRSEEHTSELQSRRDLVCRLLLEKKKTGGLRLGMESRLPTR